MERLLTTTALGLALAVTPALADQMQGSNTGTTKSMRTDPMKQEQVRKPGEMKTGQAGVEFLKQKSGDQQLATKLIGQPVYSISDEQVGDVNDLVTTPDGQIVAAVIGIGGFLGVTEKEVAVTYDSLNTRKTGEDELKVTLNISKEKLNSAPAFEASEQAANTDAAPDKENPEDETASAIIDRIKKAMQ